MLYTSIKQAENGLFFLLFESEVINMFVRRSRSEWRRANSRNVSLDTSLRWPIYVINPVHRTELSWYSPPTDAAP